MSIIQQISNLGQSIWYDNISRELLESGKLSTLVNEHGVKGLTSNPTIFCNAIKKSNDYDQSIIEHKGKSADELFQILAIADIQSAADILLPVYQQSNGKDGFVSIEVSPLLAANSKATIEEAQKLYAAVDRKNCMIKVPGTDEGIQAVEELLKLGIHVNVTLLFSLKSYVAVAEAYCRALRYRVSKGLPVDAIQSVASFFVSRVDSVIDVLLESKAKEDAAHAESILELRGKFGIINSRNAYNKFKEIFLSDSFNDLKAHGASAQRPLWASTSVKNPAFPPLLYVDKLIGNLTVNTLPDNTLHLLLDSKQKFTCELEQPFVFENDIEHRLHALGISVDPILEKLQHDGVRSFTASFEELREAIQTKIRS